MVDQVVRRLPTDGTATPTDIALAVNRLIDGIGTLSVATAYGEIHSDIGAGFSESFNQAYSVIADANMENDISRMMTVAPTSGTMGPIPESAGTYAVYVGVSFKSGTSGKNVHFALHKDGVRQPQVSFERYASNVQTGHGGALGIVEIDEGETIDLRGLVDTGTVTITINHLQITAIRLGPIA